MLMMGFSRLSGIPKFDRGVVNWRELATLHHQARLNDQLAKARMQREYNERMNARPSEIRLGSYVLCKRKQTHKHMSPWDPDPYRVIGLNGSMLTVRRTHPQIHEMTRNSSLFK